eukprot:1141354-Pelagomonas_calceolata.AAC.1
MTCSSESAPQYGMIDMIQSLAATRMLTLMTCSSESAPQHGMIDMIQSLASTRMLTLMTCSSESAPQCGMIDMIQSLASTRMPSSLTCSSESAPKCELMGMIKPSASARMLTTLTCSRELAPVLHGSAAPFLRTLKHKAAVRREALRTLAQGCCVSWPSIGCACTDHHDIPHSSTCAFVAYAKELGTIVMQSFTSKYHHECRAAAQ